MPGGEVLSLGGVQIRQDKRDLTAKLRPERVDHALELRAVRSPRREHLDDGRLLADDIEVTVPCLTRQGDDEDDRSHPERHRKKETGAPPFLRLASCQCLLSRMFLPLTHGISPHRYVVPYAGRDRTRIPSDRVEVQGPGHPMGGRPATKRTR